MNEPRSHHYQFAHNRLPELAFRFESSFLSLLGNNGEGFLQGVWYELGRTLPAGERLKADGLGLGAFETPQFCGVVITLPKALYRTEAHMVALIGHRVAGSTLGEETAGLAYRDLRYFTLEYGAISFEEPGQHGTVLCERTQKGRVNYGYGPSVDEKAFLLACIERIEQSVVAQPLKHTTRPPINHGQPVSLRYYNPAFWALGSNR